MAGKQKKKKGFVRYHEQESRMITVEDGWYWQSFENNQVKLTVSISQYISGKCIVKISAWGCDDFGVEQELTTDDFTKAKDQYDLWKTDLYTVITDGLDYNWFIECGFYRV